MDKEKALSLDADAYIKIMGEKRKKLLRKNPYLKINKVYMEKKGNIYSFAIFSDSERFYFSKYMMTDKFMKTDSISIKIDLFGHYELYTNRQIRISYSENSAYRGFYRMLDKGYVDGDTVRIRKTAVARENSLFKKRLLSIYMPNRHNFVYQPNFKTIKIQKNQNELPFFYIKGVLKKKDSLTTIREKLKDVKLEKRK